MWVAPGGAWSCPGGDQAEADGVDVTGSVVKPLCWCLATELAYGVGLHMIFEPLPGGPFAGIHGGGKESRGLVRVAEWKTRRRTWFGGSEKWTGGVADGALPGRGGGGRAGVDHRGVRFLERLGSLKACLVCSCLRSGPGCEAALMVVPRSRCAFGTPLCRKGRNFFGGQPARRQQQRLHKITESSIRATGPASVAEGCGGARCRRRRTPERVPGFLVQGGVQMRVSKVSSWCGWVTVSL